MTEGTYTEPANLRQRVRIGYEKGETIKFISHQDEFRAWERALRRAGLPLLYKRGFNPQPHIQFASPLGVGFTGRCELVDIIFSPPVAPAELQHRIASSLPPGLVLGSLVETRLHAPALQSLLIGADYRLVIYARPDELRVDEIGRRIQDFLASKEVWRTRERKGRAYAYNLRPLVLELAHEEYAPASEEHRIFLRVQQREGATGRPDEVLSALGLEDCARSLRRERLYFEDRAEDASIFATYPVVTKQGIAGSLAVASGIAPHKAKAGGPRGRSISERAGDEV